MGDAHNRCYSHVLQWDTTMSLPWSHRGQCGNRTAFCPLLERLEDRSVPTTFSVTATLDVIDPADGKRSLREAISAANNLVGADVVVIPAGVYRLTISGSGENADATGDFDIAEAVTIQGSGAGLTIIDGQQLDRVFDAIGSAPHSIRVVFQGLTVRNGNVTGDGGGIRVGNADLVIRDCVISGNRASFSGGAVSNAAAPATGNVTMVRSTVARNVAGGDIGGGLAVALSSLTVKDSKVRRNTASHDGGGIFAGTMTLTNSIVSGNSAGGSAGGIAAGTATLTNSTVSGNKAASVGGGISAITATLTNSTVSGNTADLAGGGGINTTGTATLTYCTVSGNSAGNNGGGIEATTAMLTESTVSGNTAVSDGGGIFAGTATLTNSTVSGNTADLAGGGIRADTATLTNSTVSWNRCEAGIGGGGIAIITVTLTKSTMRGAQLQFHRR